MVNELYWSQPIRTASF